MGIGRRQKVLGNSSHFTGGANLPSFPSSHGHILIRSQIITWTWSRKTFMNSPFSKIGREICFLGMSILCRFLIFQNQKLCLLVNCFSESVVHRSEKNIQIYQPNHRNLKIPDSRFPVISPESTWLQSCLIL